MVRIVRDAKLLADDLSHAPRRPKLRGEARRDCSLQQNGPQLLLQSRIQAALWHMLRLRLQGSLAARLVLSSRDGNRRHAQRLGHILYLPPLTNQIQRLHLPNFKLGRRSMRWHEPLLCQQPCQHAILGEADCLSRRKRDWVTVAGVNKVFQGNLLTH